MNRIECPECGLINRASESVCRRCGRGIGEYVKPKNKIRDPRAEAQRSSWVYTMLIVALIGGAAYYLFNGFETSYKKINADDTYRTTVPANQPQAPLSRTEYEQKQQATFKTAIKNSPGLAESDKRLAETQKLMQPAR